ncbi:MAG: RNA polymerase sigma factor [Planctomycetes bacterium]|nr:RNA polymerase sigma factor [Planctomycetota bacterium]
METTVTTSWELAIAALDGEKTTSRKIAAAPICCIDVFLARRPDLWRVAAGMGYGVADAEDVLQDVSLKAKNEDQAWQSEANCYRWLVRVTVNRCLSQRRSRSRFTRHTARIWEKQMSTEVDRDSGAGEAAQAEELECVRNSLEELTPKLLMPLTLRYFCDMKSDQIGEILATPASTIRARLRQGRLILAKQLAKREIRR